MVIDGCATEVTLARGVDCSGNYIDERTTIKVMGRSEFWRINAVLRLVRRNLQGENALKGEAIAL